MMRVRWTTDAANDLTCIVERIRKDRPEAAQRVARTIYTAVAEIRQFPNRGRIGLAENTRELVFPSWPYIVVYEVLEDQVHVLRIRHAARDWP
jgi:toxin ParE1/3/4